MYISNITIQNYRGFSNLSVDFREGINILVGQNNSGKSNLLRALALFFDSKARKQLSTNDFYNGIPLNELKQHSPKITVTVTLSQSAEEDLMGDELVTVSSWLVKLEEPYAAQIQYDFFLPEEHEQDYLNSIKNAESPMKVWEQVENLFIRLYVYKIWIGNPDNQVQVDGEDLSKFDFQFLDAIRDVERDKSKGAQFRNVFVVGNDKVKKALLEPKLGTDEEHRIAYVAFSRAQNRLFIQFDAEVISPEDEKKLSEKFNMLQIIRL